MSSNSSETLLELAIEASSRLPFDVIDHFFEIRGQVCPDELSIKCANSTLPPRLPLLALYEGELEPEGCECGNLNNLNQNGFTIFATWTCQIHGCGCVRVHWAQGKVTAFECNCAEQEKGE